jgi:putative heme utilization carrier protein HutX
VSANAAALRTKLAAEPGAIVETVAKETGATLREVVEALPEEMRRFAPASAFVPVMDEVATWGDVTFIIHTDDGVMEIGGPIPPGKIAKEYFNLSGKIGFHGHLRYQRCVGVAFVERPFFGRLSASILFLNVDGGIMFKIFVGRDEQRELIRHQLDAFRALADRLCVRETATA